jgi:DNA-binding beta-propeller fold protein YncE
MPDGIAVDWIADNIYFTESRGGRIDVVNLEGRFRRVLVDNLSSPRGLAVDPSQRCVDNVHLHFWEGWGGAGAVRG